jgi:hypothetical protein
MLDEVLTGEPLLPPVRVLGEGVGPLDLAEIDLRRPALDGLDQGVEGLRLAIGRPEREAGQYAALSFRPGRLLLLQDLLLVQSVARRKPSPTPGSGLLT